MKEFVNLYEKTKAIHKRLNGRRLLAGNGAGGRPLTAPDTPRDAAAASLRLLGDDQCK